MLRAIARRELRTAREPVARRATAMPVLAPVAARRRRVRLAKRRGKPVSSSPPERVETAGQVMAVAGRLLAVVGQQLARAERLLAAAEHLLAAAAQAELRWSAPVRRPLAPAWPCNNAEPPRAALRPTVAQAHRRPAVRPLTSPSAVRSQAACSLLRARARRPLVRRSQPLRSATTPPAHGPRHAPALQLPARRTSLLHFAIHQPVAPGTARRVAAPQRLARRTLARLLAATKVAVPGPRVRALPPSAPH
jgi:hypothetical protein